MVTRKYNIIGTSEPSNPRYKRASTKYQRRTHYARTKNIKSDSIPSFQIISLVKDNKTIKNFLNINNNNGEGDEAGEHQNEEMDLEFKLRRRSRSKQCKPQ